MALEVSFIQFYVAHRHMDQALKLLKDIRMNIYIAFFFMVVFVGAAGSDNPI